MESVLFGAAVFMFGACIGSFLNVCIHRMPLEQSIVFPGSHCPKCAKSIAFYDNIPILSWFLLGGKCRGCKAGISPRYFLIELINASVWLLLWKMFGFTPFFAAGAVLFSILIAVTATDLETGLIPDKLSLPGLAAGIIFSAVWPVLHEQTVWYHGILRSALGVLAGGGLLYGIGKLGDLWLFSARRLGVVLRRNLYWREKLKKYRHVKDSMGGGDIKLLAMMGAFLGPEKALLVFLMAPFPALPFALFARGFKKELTIPFGPFLAIAGAVSFLYGNFLIDFFMNIYGVNHA